MKRKTKTKNALLWLFEPLEGDPRFVPAKLFSFDAAYLDGKLYLAVADGEAPWNGLLVCTSRDRQAALLKDYPQLTAHPVLSKWMQLVPEHPEFETVAMELVEMARKRDMRLGVESKRELVRR
jgi:hypothetical protein